MSYKYNARLSSSPKVGVHIYEHSSSNQRNKGSTIIVKQRPTRSNNIRLQSDFDGYSDSSDSTNCSELSNASNNISSYQNRKNSVNSYSGRSINSGGTISKRTSISSKRTSLTERPPIPIKNNNIIRKMSIDSSNHESLISSSASTADKKVLNISINDQANDRALRKIMDLEILNESLRSINESLECTIKEQSLKMEQLQLQIDHLKSASTLNSTADDDFLFDFLLTKDTNSDSEIKIIPRHPQHANKDSLSSNPLSSSIPKQNEVNDVTKDNKSLLSNCEFNEDTDVQFKRICAKLEFLINDATKAVELKPGEIKKELTKEKRLSSDPNDIKIERRHNNNNNNNNEILNDRNFIKAADNNTTLIEDLSISSDSNDNEEQNNTDLTKIDEEVITEKSKYEVTEKLKSEIDSEVMVEKTEEKTEEKIEEKHNIYQSSDEIQSKYKKVFDIVGKLNDISKDVLNEYTKLEVNSNNNKSEDQIKENSKTMPSKGLAMLLNPLINYQSENNNNKASPESSNKIKELTLSMNNILENLMEVLNEEKQKELKQCEEQNQKSLNNNVRCPIVITTGASVEKPNKSGFNRRNSSVTSPKFNRSTSVERGVNVGGDSSESMMKINAILNSNGNVVVNNTGYPSILSSIPFKKDNKLFHRTRTWDPQYLNHYRTLSVQTPSSLRNAKSPKISDSTIEPLSTNSDTTSNSSIKTATSPTNNDSSTSINNNTKPNINDNEYKFQTFVQGLERKKTHLPSFYL